MTLNLLIPVYNNYKGVIDTLMSLNIYNCNHDIQIIIINDSSTDNKDYNEIINLFQYWYNIKLLNTPYNMGAGGARQYGLNHISSGYVMFIDAGDIIYSPIEFAEYLNFISENPKTLLFSPAHFEQGENGICTICGSNNNRLHGKVYHSSLFQEYKIKFNTVCTNMNEDIGFNMMCRYICKYLNYINPSIDYCIEYELPIVVWTFNLNSLTRQDNYAFYYKQNTGLGIHSVYAIEFALSHNIPFELIQYDVYDVFIHLYIFYISTLNERPEYLQESFDGALYFYTNILIKYPMDQEVFLQAYNTAVSGFLSLPNDPFNKKLPSIGILQFLTMLDAEYLREKGE